jgi:hypothetical protein
MADIDTSNCSDIIDAQGKYVSPGLSIYTSTAVLL